MSHALVAHVPMWLGVCVDPFLQFVNARKRVRKVNRPPGQRRTQELKVAYFVSLFPCWSETFIARELNCLLRMGVDVRIVSLKHPLEKIVQSDAEPLLARVIYPKTGWFGLRIVLREILLHPWRSLQEIAELATLLRHPEVFAKSVVAWKRGLTVLPTLREAAPEHLHAHWATYPSTVAMFAARRLGTPFSFTAHAHDIFLERHLLKSKIERATFGVTISEFNRRFLAASVSKRASEKVQVIHCGVAIDRLPIVEEGRAPGLIVAVGRFDEIKGFRYLVDACALLAVQGVRFECLLIGDGKLRGDLKRRVARVGLAGHVSFAGVLKQEDVLRQMRRARVFVLPSVVTPKGNRDGIPVALMEAMASGTPVISTRVSGIPELVEDNVDGLLVPPRDAVALAEALTRVLGNDVLAARLGRSGRRKVLRDFDVRKETAKLHRHILQALSVAEDARHAASWPLAPGGGSIARLDDFRDQTAGGNS